MRGHEDLKVFQLKYRLAMEIFHLSKSFPIEERFSLTDQIRRSSRSVPANIVEGYRKRQYPKMFVSKMADADGEGAETKLWLLFSKDCGYITTNDFERLNEGYKEVGRMLGKMMQNPEKFLPR
jgi:four helix bundle protein